MFGTLNFEGSFHPFDINPFDKYFFENYIYAKFHRNSPLDYVPFKNEILCNFHSSKQHQSHWEFPKTSQTIFLVCQEQVSLLNLEFECLTKIGNEQKSSLLSPKGTIADNHQTSDPRPIRETIVRMNVSAKKKEKKNSLRARKQWRVSTDLQRKRRRRAKENIRRGKHATERRIH